MATRDELITARQAFFDEVLSELKLSSRNVKEILAEHGITTFYIESVPEYWRILRLAVWSFAEKKRAEYMNKLKGLAQAPLKCPIAGCTGSQWGGNVWKWTCTEGGLRHYLAWRTANALSPEATHEQLQECAASVLARMAELDARKTEGQEGRPSHPEKGLGKIRAVPVPKELSDYAGPVEEGSLDLSRKDFG